MDAIEGTSRAGVGKASDLPSVTTTQESAVSRDAPGSPAGGPFSNPVILYSVIGGGGALLVALCLGAWLWVRRHNILSKGLPRADARNASGAIVYPPAGAQGVNMAPLGVAPAVFGGPVAGVPFAGVPFEPEQDVRNWPSWRSSW
mmetsp:Transcript_8512/g.20930  ORF Transcript_8512/g.20930 Transcript_8512/m.20930 type:complete len:145 (+) Transcript_8512:370-804(+)